MRSRFKCPSLATHDARCDQRIIEPAPFTDWLQPAEPTPRRRPDGVSFSLLLENNLRRGLVLSRGDVAAFLGDPLTLVLLALSVVIVITAVLPTVAQRRSEIVTADE